MKAGKKLERRRREMKIWQNIEVILSEKSLERCTDSSKGELTLESDSVKVIENDFLDLLVNLLLFPQDNITFPLDRSRFEFTSSQDIRDDLYRLSNVLREGFGVVDGLFSRSVGVQVSSEVLNFEFELVLRSLAGALEGHVFEEVSSSRGLVGFGARTGVDPYSDGGGRSGRGRFSSDSETVGEGRDLGERGSDVGSESTVEERSL
jgi:hypothetical protein